MKPRHSQQLALLPVVLFGAVALGSMPLVVHAQEQKPLVFTCSGPVRGSVSSAGVREFLGIPYAAPTVGDLRWRPPVPPAPWLAPLEATQFANHCPQPPSPFGIASVTEDCLFLNVFTPGSDDFYRPRAVMVWIHSGALVSGESNDYDPTALVRRINAHQLKLSRAMQHYWTNFAKFGNPNGPSVPVWQEFNSQVGNFQSLIPPSPVRETDFAASHHCAFWAALLSAQ